MSENKSSKVLIFDTTLRDGEQSPGATMSLAQKIEIANLLDEMGVDIIEAGFPIASEGDFEAVSKIGKIVNHAVICGLARASKLDIERCWRAVENSKKPRIHTFIGTSPLHREFQVKLSKNEVMDRVFETVKFAKSYCDDVQWSPMDATRTESEFLVEVVKIAIQAGASTINIPDTVGYTAPKESAKIIKNLFSKIPELKDIIVSTHCHNDLGMATANSLAAVEAGARQIECTINGLGERAGNTALEEIVMALKVRKDILPYQTNMVTNKLIQASRLVSKVSGLPVQFNKAVVGKNAFAHESGIHQDGMLKHAGTFEIMKPEDIGLTETNLVLGKHSGRAALRKKINDLGYNLGDNQLQDLFYRFKSLADKKKEIYDDDLLALLSDTAMGEQNDFLKLIDLDVKCGTKVPQTAKATIIMENKEYKVESIGDGPVDAVFNSIKKVFPHSARLQHFQIHAVTEGTDAQATVSVRLEEAGKIATEVLDPCNLSGDHEGSKRQDDGKVVTPKGYKEAYERLRDGGWFGLEGAFIGCCVGNLFSKVFC